MAKSYPNEALLGTCSSPKMQSGVPRPALSTTHGHLSEMQILLPHVRGMESEAEARAHHLALTSSLCDSGDHSMSRTTVLAYVPQFFSILSPPAICVAPHIGTTHRAKQGSVTCPVAISFRCLAVVLIVPYRSYFLQLDLSEGQL